MTLDELSTRVTETTGLDICTVESISTAVTNCFADLTSRGYRSFREMIYDNVESNHGIATIKLPKKLRKSLYFRIQFANGMANATRLSISNPRIQNRITANGFRTELYPGEVIYYIKGSDITIEWSESMYGQIDKIYYGYYERLSAPSMATSERDLNEIVINIREEFEDAVVLYCVYFFYQRAIKEDEKIRSALNNYKYLVEDLLHELAYEDTYNDDDTIIGEE